MLDFIGHPNRHFSHCIQPGHNSDWMVCLQPIMPMEVTCSQAKRLYRNLGLVGIYRHHNTHGPFPSMNLTVIDMESYYSRIKQSLPTEDEARHFHMEIIDNHARFFSTLKGDPTRGEVDLESGVLSTSSGYQEAGEGPNLLLEQLFLPDGMKMNVDDYLDFKSNDPAHHGRITSIIAHLNSHRTVPHVRPPHLPFIPQRKGDRQLFFLDGLCGGYESIYQLSVSERAYDGYRRFINPIREVVENRLPFFLDLSIYLFYRDSLLESPLRPNVIRVMATLRNTNTKIKYEFSTNN